MASCSLPSYSRGEHTVNINTQTLLYTDIHNNNGTPSSCQFSVSYRCCQLLLANSAALLASIHVSRYVLI